MKPQGPDFQTLVLTLKADRSYETISKLAGGTPTSRSLQALVQKGFTRMPNPETFEGLSRALNVRKRDLVLAAARTLGIDVGDDDQSDLVLVGAKRLPIESQELLMATSREMQAWLDGRRDVPSESRPDNVHQLPVINWASKAADRGEPGIDPEQLPED